MKARDSATPNVDLPGEDTVNPALRSGYPWVTIAWCLLLWGTPLAGQVVRGSVRDAGSHLVIPGVVVTVEPADSTVARAGLALSTLSTESGGWVVNVQRPGRYVVSAKRVGMKRFTSEPFVLGQGETRVVDVLLSPIDFTATLPVVAVTAETPCSVDGAQADEVAALWDEARAALLASRLAVRDRVFRAVITGYTRLLSPSVYRVQREETRVRRGVTEQPFRSPDAADLSARGFMQPTADGESIFYGPDASVLTSAEFIRDHCFSITRNRRARPGLVGLGFDPVTARRTPDVRGAFWMDSATHELRLVDFAYVNLPEAYDRADARGEVHFALSPRGTWYVSRWFIRMPEFGRSLVSAGVPGGTRLEVVRYKEDGGSVAVEGTTDAVRSASISGRAMDSTGRRPLAGATVRLEGTARMATVRSDGSFTIDSVAEGAYTLIMESPGYTRLGVLAAEQDLEITRSGVSMTALEALRTSSLLRRLCDLDELPDDHGVLRVLVQDSTGQPVAGEPVRLRYETFGGTDAQRMVRRPVIADGSSDTQGAVTFCSVPARIPLHLQGGTEREPGARVEARVDPLSIGVSILRRAR